MEAGKRAGDLTSAVRPDVILRYLGQFAVVLAALTALPSGVALLCGEPRFALRCAVVATVLALVGRGLARIPRPSRVQANEALVIAALTFLVASTVMVYPMMGSGVSVADAFFENVSAVTTTGLTMTTGGHEAPRLLLFLRAWMQWYGGFGIVVLSLALVTRPGVAARQLSGASADEQDLVGNTKVHARNMLVVYCALTLVATLVLAATGVSLFSAVVHALAAVATGGLSSADDRLVRFSGAGAQTLLMVFCVCGAMPLSLYHRAVRHGWREVVGDPQWRGILAAGALAAAGLVVVMRYLDGMDWGEALRRGPLLALSAQTTAGFAALEVAHLSAAAKLVLLPSMFIGGAVGSTAGGIKMLRALVLLRLVQVSIRRTCLPQHAVLEPRVGGQRLDAAEIHDASLILVLFLLVIVASWLPFLAYGYDPLDALFEVVSATSTVGLSTGVSTVGMRVPLKGILCADMLLGRLEVVALVVLVYPKTWIGMRRERS
jgi:trk system potassium uptake protein TrkH